MASKTYRAGVIPYYIDENGYIQMLFMKPSDPAYGGPNFQIAKGKVEQDETFVEGALREANEELGLFRHNITRLDDLGTFLGRTTIYLAEIADKNLFGLPQFETGETRWMTIQEFLQDGRDLHKPVIKTAQRMIEKFQQED